MKKEPFICAVLCGSMLISLAGCGNQPVPIQPETAGTSSTVIAEKSSESSQNSSVPADRMEQTEPAASGNGLAVSAGRTGKIQCRIVCARKYPSASGEPTGTDQAAEKAGGFVNSHTAGYTSLGRNLPTNKTGAG
jgi:hypothetical protein